MQSLWYTMSSFIHQPGMILSRGIIFELWTRLIIMDLLHIKCTSLNEVKSLGIFQAKHLILIALFGVAVELLDSCMEGHF